MRKTILTIIISVITTLVSFGYLSQENGEKLRDVSEQVLMIQEARDLDEKKNDETVVIFTDPRFENTTGSVGTGAMTGSTQKTGSVDYNPLNITGSQNNGLFTP